VGLNVFRRPLLTLFFLSIAGLNAAPRLRLSSAAAGPVSIALNANGTALTVQATNIGDGTLSLALTSSVPWITPTLGQVAPCGSFATPCIPILIGLPTASLPKGIYTGVVTVSDPNALDAPQDITVTVQMGGALPDKVDLYVAPNGSTQETTFNTNGPLNGVITTADNQRWLSFSLVGTGSFRFFFPYRLAVTHLPGMAEGNYGGTVTTSGSAFAPDNKTIGVTMHVTSQPVAQVTPASLMLRLAQGAPRQTYTLKVANSGLGSLALNGLFVNTGPDLSQAWLSALNQNLDVAVTIDPGGLAPGVYQGTLTLNSNAANGQLAVPVSLQIVPQGAPVVTFQGVQDNVLFASDPLAPGENAIVTGEQFFFGDPVTAPSPPPLPTNLNGVQVLVNDLPAPVFYAGYGQIGFQVPYETQPGDATLRVIRDDQVSNAVAFAVVDLAPRLMRLGVADYGFIVNQDGTNPIPVTPDGTGHPALPGDTLIIFGTGFGQTDPPATTGASAPGDEPRDRITLPVTVTFGGGFSGNPVSVQPAYAGLAPGMVGLYEFVVVVPPDVQTGANVPVTVTAGSGMTNAVRVAIDPGP
jgi:uncharacterized protein (TIGR03437 family)